MPEETPQAPPNEIDPWSIISQFSNAPTKDKVASIQVQAPNGRVRFYCPDGKRVYLLRGLNGLEWKRAQKAIPSNADEEDRQEEFMYQVVMAGCVYASTARSGQLTPEELKASAAGLPSSLFTIVSVLSDFSDPMQIEALSADL